MLLRSKRCFFAKRCFCALKDAFVLQKMLLSSLVLCLYSRLRNSRKRTRPEDRYAKELFDAFHANRMDGGATYVVDRASLKDYVMKNCTESTPMIKLAIKR